MIFTPSRSNPNLIGSPVKGARYNDPIAGPSCIMTTTSLKYLGIFINHKLNWTKHVSTMVSQAHSTIRGISILGNSIQGLDLLHWHQVYNALVTPSLTYGAYVWYTGVRQKHLIKCLEVA
jgi:hypothetical protein